MTYVSDAEFMAAWRRCWPHGRNPDLSELQTFHINDKLTPTGLAVWQDRCVIYIGDLVTGDRCQVHPAMCHHFAEDPDAWVSYADYLVTHDRLIRAPASVDA